MIEEIRQKFRSLQYEYTLHGVDQSILKGITRREVEEAVASGQIFEDYPTDKYGPTCLIFGLTAKGRPIHIQCTHPTRERVKIITLYEPDREEWIDFRAKETNMKCEVCGTGEPREQLIRYSLSIGDKLVVVEHVPAWVCNRRGETTLRPEVVERLQNTISPSRTPVRILETPVYELLP